MVWQQVLGIHPPCAFNLCAQQPTDSRHVVEAAAGMFLEASTSSIRNIDSNYMMDLKHQNNTKTACSHHVLPPLQHGLSSKCQGVR
jgi:hypothetical protein